MKRVWLGGLGVVVGGLLVQGCFALDWDFNGAAGAGGSGGEGSSVSSSSSSGSSSSGLPPNEDCTNGVDDDSDGKADCQDSDCFSGYECKAAVPAGWSPYWLLEKTYQDPNATICPDGLAATTWFVQPAVTATCETCSCSFNGATCSSPEFRCSYSDAECMNWGMPGYKSAGLPSCYVLPNTPGGSGSYGSCAITGPATPVNYGTCVGTPSSVLGPGIFGGELRLCQAPTSAGAGCSFGDACVTKKPGAFGQGRTCIEQAGETQCPDGWQAKQFVAYENGTDMRACANCNCDTSTITCSGGAVRVHYQKSCAWLEADLTIPNQCLGGVGPFDLSGASANFTMGTPSAGTCTQAVASGVVDGVSPHTICCRD